MAWVSRSIAYFTCEIRKLWKSDSYRHDIEFEVFRMTQETTETERTTEVASTLGLGKPIVNPTRVVTV